MGTTLVKAQVIDQSLQITSKPKIASGGVDETIIEWAFCELWEGFTKTAIFYMTENTPYYALISDDNLCTIPHEAVANDGVLNFGVFGADPDGVVRTSEIARYKIVKGAITEGLQPSDPTPEFWEQMLSRIEELYQREVAFENANRLEVDPDSENWILGGKDTGMLARATQMHVKWSAAYPTKNSDMTDIPDKYIGIYVGKETTAPADFTVYKWYCYYGGDIVNDQMRLMLEAHDADEDAHGIAELFAGLATVAKTGSYNDLKDAPLKGWELLSKQYNLASGSLLMDLPKDYKAYRITAHIYPKDGTDKTLGWYFSTGWSATYKDVRITGNSSGVNVTTSEETYSNPNYILKGVPLLKDSMLLEIYLTRTANNGTIYCYVKATTHNVTTGNFCIVLAQVQMACPNDGVIRTATDTNDMQMRMLSMEGLQ